MGGAVVAGGLVTASAEPFRERDRLTSDDVSSGDGFALTGNGRNLALSGDTLLVGAYQADIGVRTNQGAAYVFVRDENGWTQQAKLVSSDGRTNDWMGSSVALSGDTAVAGGRGTANDNSAYVFVRSAGVWTQQQKITGPVSSQFSVSLALDGDTLAVGADTELGRGAVYVYTRSGGVWTQQQRIAAPTSSTVANFGASLALSGDTLLIGDPYADGTVSNDQGAAYVYVRSGGAWALEDTLVAPDAAQNDGFGACVSLDGDLAAVGAANHKDGGLTRGEVHVFTRSGTTWTRDHAVVGSGNMIALGRRVSVSGNRIVAADAAAAATVLTRLGGQWSATMLFSGAPESPAEVAILGDRIAAGSADLGTSTGFVRILTPERSQYLLPSKVLVKPASSALKVSGTLHTGLATVDFTAPFTVRVGDLDIAVPGMTSAAPGKPYTYAGSGVKLTVVPGKGGSSRAKFKLSRTGALSGAVPTEGTVLFALTGSGLDAAGAVSVKNGSYTAKKAPGELTEPSVQLSSLKAKLKGAGKDSLQFVATFAAPGTAGPWLKPISVRVGNLDVAFQAVDFYPQGKFWGFKGDRGGIKSLIVDSVKGTITVKAAALDLGTFADGPADLPVRLTVGTETAEFQIRASHTGPKLKY